MSIVPAGAPARRVRVRWWITAAYCAFTFTIPLEYPNRTFPAEVHTITAAVFLLVSASQPAIWFEVPPAATWWLGAYVWVYLAMSVFVDHRTEALRLLVNYGLVLLLFWIGSNLMARERLARAALWSFVLGSVVIAMLTLVADATGSLQNRQMVLGQNANLLGGNTALAFVMLIVLMFTPAARIQPSRLLPGCVTAAVLIAATLVTSSRGALLAAAAGFVAFAAGTRPGRARRRALAVTGVLILVLAGAVYRSAPTWERYRTAVSQGGMSGREVLYPEAWRMFLEKPLFGWGPMDNTYELGRRTASYAFGQKNAEGRSRVENRDVHNLVLDALTGMGIVGLVPLAICVGLCLHGAWAARAGPRAAAPLALAVVVLLLSMDNNWSASKIAWTVMAYAAISGSSRRAWRVSRYSVPAGAEAVAVS